MIAGPPDRDLPAPASEPAASQLGPLKDLIAWYKSQFDGDWEHGAGIKIATLDNPGWKLAVDLSDTQWSGTEQDRRFVERSDTDWVSHTVTNGQFCGACGVDNFAELLDEFLAVVRE